MTSPDRIPALANGSSEVFVSVVSSPPLELVKKPPLGQIVLMHREEPQIELISQEEARHSPPQQITVFSSEELNPLNNPRQTYLYPPGKLRRTPFEQRRFRR